MFEVSHEVRHSGELHPDMGLIPAGAILSTVHFVWQTAAAAVETKMMPKPGWHRHRIMVSPLFDLFVVLLLCFTVQAKRNSQPDENVAAVIVPIVLNHYKYSNYKLYGSVKSSVLTLLALDSRLRYCQAHDLKCIVVPAQSANVSSKASTRLSKLAIIQVATQSYRKCCKFVYVDTDIVISSHKQNIFDNEFFKGNCSSGRVLGLTKDLTNTTSTDNTVKYQTGVMFLRGTDKVAQLLADWTDQYNRSKTTLPALEQRWRNGMGSAEVTVKDSAPWDSDQWLLSALLQSKPQNQALVEEVGPRHVYNAFPLFGQAGDNTAGPRGQAAQGGGHTERVVRNGTDILAGLWRDMRLTQGDEVPGESLLVHFAGVFGGANAATGVSDPLVTLLAVQGYVLRHLQFVQGLAAAIATGDAGEGQGPGAAPRQRKMEGRGSIGCTGPYLNSAKTLSQQDETAREERRRHDRKLRGRDQLPSSGPLTCPALELVPHNAAVQVLTNIATRLTNCAVQMFSAEAYTQGTAEATAQRCLQDVRRRSEQLFLRYARLERKVTVAAAKATDGRIYHCSPELL